MRANGRWFKSPRWLLSFFPSFFHLFSPFWPFNDRPLTTDTLSRRRNSKEVTPMVINQSKAVTVHGYIRTRMQKLSHVGGPCRWTKQPIVSTHLFLPSLVCCCSSFSRPGQRHSLPFLPSGHKIRLLLLLVIRKASQRGTKDQWPVLTGGGRREGKETMSTPSRRRLMRDFKRLQEDPPSGVSGAPTDNNIMIWNAVIFGWERTHSSSVFSLFLISVFLLSILAAINEWIHFNQPHEPMNEWIGNVCSPHDTPFEDGTFKLTLEFTEEYPNKPPTVRFVSKMFHPNGTFCEQGSDSRSLTPWLHSLILQCTQTDPFVWTSCRTGGHRRTTSLPSSPRSSRCWTNRIPTRPPTLWPPNCIKRTAESTRNEWRPSWSSPGSTLQMKRRKRARKEYLPPPLQHWVVLRRRRPLLSAVAAEEEVEVVLLLVLLLEMSVYTLIIKDDVNFIWKGTNGINVMTLFFL